MAADLSIHVITEEATDEHFKVFASHTIGSKYGPTSVPGVGLAVGYRHPTISDDDQLWSVIGKSPQIWIGEVSWLKAAIFEDGEEAYIPPPVAQVHELIGEDFPVLDEELKLKILGALTLENKTGYNIAKSEDVGKFLDEHMGKKLCTISW